MLFSTWKYATQVKLATSSVGLISFTVLIMVEKVKVSYAVGEWVVYLEVLFNDYTLHT
jgi:hypothetical protein